MPPNVSALQGGTIDIVMLNSGILASQVKDFEVYDFPFMFANAKEADAVVDGPFGQKLHAKLAEKGIVGLAYWELGFRNITNSKRADHQGRGHRRPEAARDPQRRSTSTGSRRWAPTRRRWPSPRCMPRWSRRRSTARRTRCTVILANKFAEVQKHLALTNHQYNPQSVIFSKKVWDTLSDDEKKILPDAAIEAAKFQRQVSRDAARHARRAEEGRHAGHRAVAAAEQAKLRDKLKPVIDKHGAAIAGHRDRAAGRAGQAAQVKSAAGPGRKALGSGLIGAGIQRSLTPAMHERRGELRRAWRCTTS